MTSKEVSERFNIAESTIKKQFKRVQTNILNKYNLHLMKEGRGEKAYYYIEEEDFRHKTTIYEEESARAVDIYREDLKLIDLQFFCFLVIMLTPFGTFRGNYEMFAKYADIKLTPALVEAISALIERDLIIKTDDNSTGEGYFILSIKRKIEKEISVKVDLRMMRECKYLADKHKKRSWIPLFKIWAGVNSLGTSATSTNKELAELTGLTENQIRTYGKILRDEGALKSERVYIDKGTSNIKCIGTNKTIAAEWGWQNEKFVEK